MEIPILKFHVEIKDVQTGPKFYLGSNSADDTKPCDDFYPAWDKFLSSSPTRRAATSTLAKRVERAVKAASEDDNGLNSHKSPVKSYEEAIAECRAKVRAIVAECERLNQKYVDRHFDIDYDEHDCIHPLGNSDYDNDGQRPSAVKRIEDIFENPKFNEDNASAADVVQGKLGDCWLLAALMSLSAKPGLIKRLCVDRDEKIGVYGFVFFRDGAWVPEVIDDRLFLHVADGDDIFVGRYVETCQVLNSEVSTTLYDINKLRENLQKGGTALYFARCKNDSDTWLPLIEKAYAKAHGDYGSIEGGSTSEGIEDLTGGVSVALTPSRILDKFRFWASMKAANETYLYAGAAKHYERGGKVAHHAYAVLQVAEYGTLKLLKLRDPWGRHQDDGPWMHKFTEWTSELVDALSYNFKDPGVFWMTYENFLRHFYKIYRTRLFSDNWKATQQWTSVNVSPIAEYLDTKFVFTLSQSGPVVLVLCQPDERYFRGLEGRYEYSLHFRIYSSDAAANTWNSSSSSSSRYLARSMHGSGTLHQGLRSVSAELDLSSGTYSVLCKITSERRTSRVPSGAVVKTYNHRRAKLLQAGQNFDLAHAKGKRRDLEIANKQRTKEEAKAKRNEENATNRTRQQERKKRQRKERERIENERKRQKEVAFWKDVHEKAASKGIVVSDAVPGLSSSSNLAGALTGLNIGSAAGLEADEDIDNDDFEWDPEIDGSVSDDEKSSDDANDLYAEDPWNAICVLGLRVYSQNGEAKIKVVEGESGDDAQDKPRSNDQGVTATFDPADDGESHAEGGAQSSDTKEGGLEGDESKPCNEEKAAEDRDSEEELKG